MYQRSVWSLPPSTSTSSSLPNSCTPDIFKSNTFSIIKTPFPLGIFPKGRNKKLLWYFWRIELVASFQILIVENFFTENVNRKVKGLKTRNIKDCEFVVFSIFLVVGTRCNRVMAGVSNQEPFFWFLPLYKNIKKRWKNIQTMSRWLITMISSPP